MSTIEAQFAELLRAIDRADAAYQASRKAEAKPLRKGNRLFARLMRRHGRGELVKSLN